MRQAHTGMGWVVELRLLTRHLVVCGYIIHHYHMSCVCRASVSSHPSHALSASCSALHSSHLSPILLLLLLLLR